MLTKTCRDCGEEFPTDNFYARNDGKPSSYCKPCHKKRARASTVSRYVPHPRPKLTEDEKRERRNRSWAKYQERSREWFVQYKSDKSCVECGEAHPACLDFHHVDPAEKECSPGLMANRGWSIERMEAELSKCVALCSNCHRKLHASLRCAS